MIRHLLVMTTAVTLALALMPAALATETVTERGVEFSTQATLDSTPLRLTGTGVVRYRIIFTVYAAGFYLPANSAASEVLDGETPRRLEIEYFHTINAEDIVRAANLTLERQLDPATHERLRPAIDAFHALYQGVREEDRYRMDYVPGTGTTLSLNGEPVGTIPGADFAAAYFGIWLDADDPLSTNLRRNLLAGLEE